MNRLAYLIPLALLAGSTLARPPASAGRLDEVAERGRQVMPFDLEKTQHIFSKTEHGGIQQVIVKDADDGEQIGLIRNHLFDISQRMQQGDFSRQRQIHGADMPGLAELSSDYRHVRFAYHELSNGAEIEFSAEDSALVGAIHRYFNAQLSDHGRHAVGKGMQCEHHQHRQQWQRRAGMPQSAAGKE